MHLLAPLFAIGTVLAAIPILLHLFGRDRAPKKKFPAARLLIQAQRNKAPRARLEQWLLVALRVAVVSALAMALARPIWERPRGLPPSAGLRQTAVIVLDDSLSMARRLRGRSIYDRGRAQAKELVRAFADGSEAAILATTRLERDPLPRLERDRALLLDALDRATVSRESGSTTGALARAAAVLANAGSGVRRIYLISDLARHGFDAVAPRPFPADGELGLTVIPVGDEKLPNDAVVDVSVSPTAERGSRRLRVTGEVRSDDWPAHVRTVSLLVDGRPVARGLVELAPGQTISKRFDYALRPDEEPKVVELVLEPDFGDTLALDDRRGAALDEQRGRILLVDGAPGSSRREDETFYLETALLTARGGGSQVEVIRQDALDRTDLGPFAIVMLCNPRPSPALAALRPFVERGGGLLVSVGDNFDPALSSELSALLPSAIEGVRDLSGPGGVAGGALRLERSTAALLRRVPSLGDERATDAWRAARTSKVALVTPLPEGDSAREVLARFEDGTPALLERKVGRGRVIELTTTIDRGWSDLAIQPVFPPLVLELADHLSRREGALAGHPDVYALDAAESDPSRLNPARLQTPPPSAAPAHPPARELWHALALAMLLALLVEAALAVRG